MKKAKKAYMKELSTQKFLLPFTVIILAIIIISFASLSLVKKVRSDSKILENDLSSCQEILEQKEDKLVNILSQLNLTQKDIERYDQIYENASSTAEQLQEELEIEKEKEPEIIEVCEVPYRSVANYKDFNKAARMELMLEKLDKADSLLKKEVVHEEDLRISIGYMYFVSTEFLEIMKRGLPKGEKANEWYMDAMEYHEEIDGIYHFFDEYNRKKLKTRLPQIIKIQRNIVEGMQSYYFM